MGNSKSHHSSSTSSTSSSRDTKSNKMQKADVSAEESESLDIDNINLFGSESEEEKPPPSKTQRKTKHHTKGKTKSSTTPSTTPSSTPNTTSPTSATPPSSEKMIKVSQERLTRLLETETKGFDDPDKEKAIQCKRITKWKEMKGKVEGDCPICLCELEEDVVKLSNCVGHHFHRDCIVHCHNEHHNYLKCPICNYIYGVRMGNMPQGTMTVTRSPKGTNTLSGYSNCGTIVINYNFPGGVQGPEHPNPGVAYSGTSRVCYLPDNADGNEVLKLLQLAFDRRLSFTVGTSVTTGTSNTVIWNGIHHKTALSGGPTSFGYPDETYFARVKGELKDMGVV